MIRHLTLHLTNSCNLNCDYCHVAASQHSSTQYGLISDGNIKKLFPPSVNSVSFAGGEPFFSKQNLYHLINLLPNYIQSVAITTNGTLLTDGDFEFLKTKNIRLQFSIDGCKYFHDSNRGTGCFDIAMRNIFKAISYGIRVDLLTTVSKSNIQSMDEFLRSVDRKGIENITLLHFTPKGRGEIHNTEEIEDKEWIAFVFNLIRRDKTRFTRIWVQPRFLTQEMIKLCNAEREITYCNCYSPSFAYVDLTTGNVYPCGLSFNTPIKFGNIKDPKIKSINELIAERPNYIIPEDCQDCEYLSSCKGGAKCYAWLSNKDYNSKDNHCDGSKWLPICPFPAIMVSGEQMHTKKPTII